MRRASGGPAKGGQTARAPDRSAEIGLPSPVCGIDEVGRGPLCGPVVAAAVILPGPCDVVPDWIADLRDSKKMTEKARDRLAEAVRLHCRYAIGEASPAEIDSVGILSATFLAMARAVAGLGETPAHALVDGNLLPRGLPCPATAIVSGDATCLAIAAAAVVAKVHRDALMADLGAAFPGYGWERNAGYGTQEHRDAIERLGVTPHHRRSFTLVDNQLSLAL